jgi:hypothetical protein
MPGEAHVAGAASAPALPSTAPASDGELGVDEHALEASRKDVETRKV